MILEPDPVPHLVAFLGCDVAPGMEVWATPLPQVLNSSCHVDEQGEVSRNLLQR
jgi:hypothetical protein